MPELSLRRVGGSIGPPTTNKHPSESCTTRIQRPVSAVVGSARISPPASARHPDGCFRPLESDAAARAANCSAEFVVRPPAVLVAVAAGGWKFRPRRTQFLPGRDPRCRRAGGILWSMAFECRAHERVDAVDVDRVRDHRGLLRGEGVEPGGETGPAARHGQFLDLRMMLPLRRLRGAGGRRRARRSRFSSWFKDGSGDMRVTPWPLGCHPVRGSGVTMCCPPHRQVVAGGATVFASDGGGDALLVAAGDETELGEGGEAALHLPPLMA